MDLDRRYTVCSLDKQGLSLVFAWMVSISGKANYSKNILQKFVHVSVAKVLSHDLVYRVDICVN